MRAVVTALAVAVMAGSVADYLSWRAAHARLATVARRVMPDERAAAARRELGRQASPARAAVRLGWLLLRDETDRGWIAALSEEERGRELRRGSERLAAARRLAAEAWPLLPASWQAATTVGAATYLERFRSRDDRLFTEQAAWRLPLETAARLAPGMPEPVRFLAAAELGNFSRLDAGERRRAVETLARAFANAGSFELLIEPWVRVAPSLDTLLEPIPDRPEAWRRLETLFARRDDLERFAVARHRWQRSLAADREERLQRARARLRGGAAHTVTGLLSSILTTPPERAPSAAVSGAIELLADETADRRLHSSVEQWLLWNVALCPVAGCPLPPATAARALDHAPGLAPADHAAAALAAGLEERAAALEAAHLDPADPAWGDALVFKAWWLAAAGRPDAARQSLAAAPTGRQALREVVAAELAGRRPAAGRARWDENEWVRRGSAYHLQLLPACEARGLVVSLAGVFAPGAVLGVQWDGDALLTRAVTPGEPLRVAVPLTRELHLLVLTPQLGRVSPTRVELTPPCA